MVPDFQPETSIESHCFPRLVTRNSSYTQKLRPNRECTHNVPCAYIYIPIIALKSEYWNSTSLSADSISAYLESLPCGKVICTSTDVQYGNQCQLSAGSWVVCENGPFIQASSISEHNGLPWLTFAFLHICKKNKRKCQWPFFIWHTTWRSSTVLWLGPTVTITCLQNHKGNQKPA